MKKIIILNCTNRTGSNSLKISKLYQRLLKEKNNNVEIFELSDLPETIVFTELYGKRSVEYSELIKKNITDQENFIFVVPEYNGGFPGILKVFLDSIPPKEWANKKACLVGVSTGRAGNLRGMDQLAAILHYLKMHVYYNKLPISLVDKLIDEDGNFISEDQKNVCLLQLEGFLNF
ncbi:MAG: NAD(P)H-dependent oxidoreductase [Bacteroidota bacterium]|nr:NAD(P)H-dependent oxidoreductase [Bacteroidota bacterium]